MLRQKIVNLEHTSARFWKYVIKGPSCWEWQGARNQYGYGESWMPYDGQNVQMRAHRLAYLLEYGTLPEKGLIIRHLCGNRACCNPTHLAPGTHKDNADDRDAMGRTKRGTESWSYLHKERVARGERNGAAKLSANQVKEIRRKRGEGALIIPLAREFGVSKSLICMIIHRQKWAHVP